MDNITCKTVYSAGVLTVTVSGEIDHHTAKPLRERIDAAIYLFRAPSVVMDVAGVSFMDSAGLGLILGRYTKIRELGGRMTVRAPTPETEKILRLAGADKLIEIVKKEGERV